jgi:hypothetical protein
MTIRSHTAILLTGCALLLGACGGDDETSTSSSTATTPPATEPAPSTTEPSTTEPEPSTPSEGTTEKVSANTASVGEIAAALEAAGVDNAERWAREVEEYRPYDDDPDLPKLRDELAKYNPGAGVVDQIVGALTP